jgi:organic hydroperoxide reductase OsmC/OhrA
LYASLAPEARGARPVQRYAGLSAALEGVADLCEDITQALGFDGRRLLMSEHRAQLRWKLAGADFTYQGYNRAHDILFKNGKVVLPGSAAPEFRGDPGRVDPEEAFVASLSGCHMLTFLAICSRKRFAVDSYEDDASGRLEKGSDGKLWIAHVTLRPLVSFRAGVEMDAEQLAALHHQAHQDCFIANSVKTHIAVEPRH